jgi:hypothetical protein
MEDLTQLLPPDGLSPTEMSPTFVDGYDASI